MRPPQTTHNTVASYIVIMFYVNYISRGVSSVVRRCVHRHTGQELAVKIIEITAEKMTAQQLEEVKTSTLKEIHVLNMVKGHASISKLGLFTLALFMKVQK